MQRIATDIGSYYEAAYVPVSQEFDGKFRKISVKVTRPDVTVQSRSGYFALPPGEGSAMLPFEMPLLTALTVEPPPHAFDYQASALQFQDKPGGPRAVLLFEVPLQGMTFQADKKKKTYKLRFSLLALVKDAEGTSSNASATIIRSRDRSTSSNGSRAATCSSSGRSAEARASTRWTPSRRIATAAGPAS